MFFFYFVVAVEKESEMNHDLVWGLIGKANRFPRSASCQLLSLTEAINNYIPLFIYVV